MGTIGCRGDAAISPLPKTATAPWPVAGQSIGPSVPGTTVVDVTSAVSRILLAVAPAVRATGGPDTAVATIQPKSASTRTTPIRRRRNCACRRRRAATARCIAMCSARASFSKRRSSIWCAALLWWGAKVTSYRLLLGLVEFCGCHQHLAGLGALRRAYDAPALEQVHQPPGAGEPDAELSLQHRGRAELGPHHELEGLTEELVVVVRPAEDPGRAGVVLTDNRFVVDGLRLSAPVPDDGPYLLLGDPRALDPAGDARGSREQQQVATADQALRSGLVEDDPAVGERRDRERQARRDVGLDDAGDDVDGRALGGDDEGNPDRPRHLGDPADRLLDVSCRDHHQVVQLVDDDQDEGQLRRAVVVGTERGIQIGGDRRVVFGDIVLFETVVVGVVV